LSSAERHGITTGPRVACWLANILHESGGLSAVRENLNYTSANMMQVWPHVFPTIESTLPYLGHPQALADYVYAKLGGWNRIGRGWGQVTGEANYEACAKACSIPIANLPAWMETPVGAAESAAWYFEAAGCGPLADGNDLLDVRNRWAGKPLGFPNPFGFADVKAWHERIVRAMATTAPSSLVGSVEAMDLPTLAKAQPVYPVVQDEDT
jgi:putative chitinase